MRSPCAEGTSDKRYYVNYTERSAKANDGIVVVPKSVKNIRPPLIRSRYHDVRLPVVS
jgi:hypothetical protein